MIGRTARTALLTLSALLVASLSSAGLGGDVHWDASAVSMQEQNGFAAIVLTRTERTPAQAIDVRPALRAAPRFDAVPSPVHGPAVGAPSLPAEIRQFVIPSDMRVEDIVISALSEEQLPGVYRIMPVQPEVPIGETPQWADPDPTIYEKDELYPPRRIEYLGDGYLGGYRIASVAIYPLRYNPVQGKLVLATELSFDLSLAAGADRSLPRERITSRSDALYRKLVRSVVSNPEDLGVALRRRANVVEDVGPEGFAPRYTPSLEGSPVEYVIITNETLEPYFQEFADWKTKKGVPTVVKTVSWIDSSYPGGCDTPERIRMFIRDAYTTWGTTYVLIGGDTNIVPVRYVYSLVPDEGAFVLSDLYYSDLDGNWNDDGDHLFGEAYAGVASPGDSLDLYPDVFVGRAPVTDATEAEIFIDKTLTYGKTPTAHFTDRNLYLAEVFFPYDWEPGQLITLDGAADAVEPSLEHVPDHIRVVKLYQNYFDYPESYPLDRDSAIDSLNRGYNIASHLGHGNKDVLRVSKGNYLSLGDVDNLENGTDKAGFLWLLNCSTAAIRYDCVAEHFLANEDGGATAVWGPTAYAYAYAGSEFYVEWFNVFYTHGIDRAGLTCLLSNVGFIGEAIWDTTYRWTILSYVYLGDPELRLWTARPEALFPEAPDALYVGAAGCTVHVGDPAPVDSALVCVFKDNDIFAAGYTGADGNVALSFTPDSTGVAHVTVTARNHLPCELALPVELPAAQGPFIHLVEVAVDDDTAGASSGNGNGLPEAGETIELDLTIRNGGTAAADTIEITVSTGDPYVLLSDPTETVLGLGPGETVVVAGAIALSIDSGCENCHNVAFDIEFAVPDREVWLDSFSLTVLAPRMVIILTKIDDSTGDGYPDPGDTLDIAFTAYNDGNGRADGVSAVLSYPGIEISVTDSLGHFGDMDPRDPVTLGGFRAVVIDSVTGPFTLSLEDARGHDWTKTIDLFRPEAATDLGGSVWGTTIELAWMPSNASDLWGYNIYRALNTGDDFEKANEWPVEGVSCYSDAGLDENTAYLYCVTILDSSANESAASETLSISTNPPMQTGWPLPIGFSECGTPLVWDIDDDGGLEIVVGAEKVYAWHYDGTEVRDGDGDPRTNGVFAPEGEIGFRSSLALGELDGTPGTEIVGAAWGEAEPGGDSIYRMYAYNGEDGSIVDGWPVEMPARSWSTPALADLDGDGTCEVVIACSDRNLYVWKADGSELIDGDNNPATIGVFAVLGEPYNYSSPAVVDLDRDGDTEIIQAGYGDTVRVFNPDGSTEPGWPFGTGGPAMSSPLAADIDGDGDTEIIVASNSDKIWALEANGDIMTGWPKTVNLTGDFPPSPAVGDLTGDGKLEVVLATRDSIVEAWSYLGDALPGWPVRIGGAGTSTAAIADIDADPDVEIIVAASDARIYALSTGGDIVDGWPIQLTSNVTSTPTVADVDGDGDTEVVVAGSDLNIYVWDCAGSYNEGDGVHWGTFKHDTWRTSHYGFREIVSIEEDPEQNGALCMLSLEQNWPNPFNPVTNISFVVPPRVGSPPLRSGPHGPDLTPGTGDPRVLLAVYDLTGRRVRTLVDGPSEPGSYVTSWDGSDDRGERVASGVYFLRLETAGGTVTRKAVLLK